MATDSVSDVQQYLAWYDRRAQRARALFLVGRGIELVAAAAIPILVLGDSDPLITAGLGALIAVVAGLEQLLRFQETWINYRQTAEALRTELFLYRAGAGPYDGSADARSAEKQVVERTAALLMQENSRWNAIATRATNPDQPAGGAGRVLAQ